MKVKDYKKEYQWFSAKLSDNTRKLAFAGIAIVWIFKQEENGTFGLPHMLKLAMLMFAITLSFDLLQYIYQASLWGIFHRYYEKKFGEDHELTAPKYFNWPALIFSWFKVATLLFGYVFMVKFLW